MPLVMTILKNGNNATSHAWNDRKTRSNKELGDGCFFYFVVLDKVHIEAAWTAMLLEVHTNLLICVVFLPKQIFSYNTN
jgi:hypothetical protein